MYCFGLLVTRHTCARDMINVSLLSVNRLAVKLYWVWEWDSNMDCNRRESIVERFYPVTDDDGYLINYLNVHDNLHFNGLIIFYHWWIMNQRDNLWFGFIVYIQEGFLKKFMLLCKYYQDLEKTSKKSACSILTLNNFWRRFIKKLLKTFFYRAFNSLQEYALALLI